MTFDETLFGGVVAQHAATVFARDLAAKAGRLTSDKNSPSSPRYGTTGRTVAGLVITPDNAISISTVWACLRYLSQTVAVLPWRVKFDGPKGPTTQDTHPNDWLLWKRPSPEWSSFQFRETLTHWALRWGNGYAEIQLDRGNRPFGMWPLHPESVQVCRALEDFGDDEIFMGDIYYEYRNKGAVVNIPAKRMFHVRGFGEGPVGVNVIQYAAQSLGWARAAQIFGAGFFGNGLYLGGVVVNKKALTTEGLEKQKEEMKQAYGGPAHSNGWAHFDNDVEVKTISVEPEKAQMIEANMFLVEEICRWFGVPPHKVMHLLRSTFNNIEHQAIEVVVDGISPWAKRFEDEADYKLFGQNRSGLYTKMNMNALLRGDSKSRAEFYKQMFEMGSFSPNDVLRLEDSNTLGPDGDKHFVQSQYVTLDKAGNGPTPPAAPTAPAQIGHNGGPPMNVDDERHQDEIRQLAEQLGMIDA